MGQRMSDVVSGVGEGYRYILILFSLVVVEYSLPRYHLPSMGLDGGGGTRD